MADELDDFTWFVNQEHCPIHHLFYNGQCGPCAREKYESERKKTVFNYRIEQYYSFEEFQKEVREAGKEGVEYEGHSVHTVVTQDKGLTVDTIYTVTFRIHHSVT